jgi:ribosomal protein S7
MKLRPSKIKKRIINYFIKNGKKTIARKIFSNLIRHFFKKRRFFIYRNVFLSIISYLLPNTKLKFQRRGRREITIPCPINKNTSLHLAISGLMKSLKKNEKPYITLGEELLKKKNKKAPSFARRRILRTNALAYRNRANMHFRW